MTPVVSKVFAYITNQSRLLIFCHTDFPEAGIQVPAGTVKANEDLAAAVLREAEEETSLQGLTIKTYLGEQIRNMEDCGKNEIHHRHFYHLLCKDDPPSEWQHAESDPSDGGSIRIRFDFFWATIPDQIPELICDHGIMLPLLGKSLRDE